MCSLLSSVGFERVVWIIDVTVNIPYILPREQMHSLTSCITGEFYYKMLLKGALDCLFWEECMHCSPLDSTKHTMQHSSENFNTSGAHF